MTFSFSCKRRVFNFDSALKRLFVVWNVCDFMCYKRIQCVSFFFKCNRQLNKRILSYSLVFFQLFYLAFALIEIWDFCQNHETRNKNKVGVPFAHWTEIVCLCEMFIYVFSEWENKLNHQEWEKIRAATGQYLFLRLQNILNGVCM